MNLARSRMGRIGKSSVAITYSFRDKFTTNRAGGAVNGTAAEPGPGNRAVTDGNSNLSLASGYAISNSLTGASPSIGWPTVPRTLGKVIAIRGYGGGSTFFGISASINGGLVLGYNIQSDGNIRSAVSGFQNFDSINNKLGKCVYWLILILRPAGAWFYIQGGKYPYPTLIYYERIQNTATIYPEWKLYAASIPWFTDFCVPKKLFIPTALLSDNFDRADGAVGGTWTDITGTATISTNKLVITPNTGIGIVVAESGKTDTMIIVNPTRSAGTVGIITHYIDANNYLRVILDGTNFQIIQRLAGSESTLATAALAYSAGADILVETTGVGIQAWYNNNAIASSPSSMNATLASATKVGLWSSDASNTLNDFEVYARGTNNEYAGLGNGSLTKGSRLVSFDGDSLTAGASPTPYPTQLAALYSPAILEFNNYGISGQSMAQMVTNSPAKLDGHYAYWNKMILVAWGGTNDIAGGASDTTTYNSIVSYCQARRIAGYKVCVCTILPRSGFSAGQETIRLSVNTNIVTNFASFADALIDLAAIPSLQTCTNETYYNVDHTHLNDTGNGVVAAAVKAVIDTL